MKVLPCLVLDSCCSHARLTRGNESLDNSHTNCDYALIVTALMFGH